MRDRSGGADEFRGPAEESLAAGRGDDAGHRALLGDAARIGLVSDLLGNGHRLAGERRLIAAQIFAISQDEVSRHDLPRRNTDDVTRHQTGGIDGDPTVVAQYAGARCQAFFSGQRAHSLPCYPAKSRRRRCKAVSR